MLVEIDFLVFLSYHKTRGSHAVRTVVPQSVQVTRLNPERGSWRPLRDGRGQSISSWRRWALRPRRWGHWPERGQLCRPSSSCGPAWPSPPPPAAAALLAAAALPPAPRPEPGRAGGCPAAKPGTGGRREGGGRYGRTMPSLIQSINRITQTDGYNDNYYLLNNKCMID